jgi:hypothetical protein
VGGAAGGRLVLNTFLPAFSFVEIAPRSGNCTVTENPNARSSAGPR